MMILGGRIVYERFECKIQSVLTDVEQYGSVCVCDQEKGKEGSEGRSELLVQNLA